SLLARPALTITVLVVLSLGIGANTALFSVVNGVLLKPLPFRESNSIVAIWEHKASIQNGRKFRPAYMEYQEWVAQAQSLGQIEGIKLGGYSITGEGEPEQVTGASVTPGFFNMLGVPAILGKTFSPDDSSGPPLVVVSYRLWQRRFAGSQGVVGKLMTLNSTLFTIIGVMPAFFEFQDKGAELWTMITPEDEYFR